MLKPMIHVVRNNSLVTAVQKMTRADLSAIDKEIAEVEEYLSALKVIQQMGRSVACSEMLKKREKQPRPKEEGVKTLASVVRETVIKLPEASAQEIVDAIMAVTVKYPRDRVTAAYQRYRYRLKKGFENGTTSLPDHEPETPETERPAVIKAAKPLVKKPKRTSTKKAETVEPVQRPATAIPEEKLSVDVLKKIANHVYLRGLASTTDIAAAHKLLLASVESTLSDHPWFELADKTGKYRLTVVGKNEGLDNY